MNECAKIFYAMITDRWRPFGSRRRVWMVAGWAGGVGCTVILALIGDSCSVNTWLALSIATQACLMVRHQRTNQATKPNRRM